MAAKKQRKGPDRPALRIRWEKRNQVLLGSGLAAVVLGYVLLRMGDITAAPLLLVAGYCVLVPLAFILSGPARTDSDKS